MREKGKGRIGEENINSRRTKNKERSRRIGNARREKKNKKINKKSKEQKKGKLDETILHKSSIREQSKKK